jgi:hypothetical protein
VIATAQAELLRIRKGRMSGPGTEIGIVMTGSMIGK